MITFVPIVSLPKSIQKSTLFLWFILSLSKEWFHKNIILTAEGTSKPHWATSCKMFTGLALRAKGPSVQWSYSRVWLSRGKPAIWAWIGRWVTECIRINWCIVDHITWVYQSISVSLPCLTKVQIIPSWTNIPHYVSLARLNTAAVLHWPREQLNKQLTEERESIRFNNEHSPSSSSSSLQIET